MGERAYAYAKACGIIGKSFVGKRIGNLERASRLSELDRIIFPFTAQNMPEKELLHDLEKRITTRAVTSIISMVECFSEAPAMLVLLLRSYEYADLKNALFSYLEKEKDIPHCTDIGRYQTVRFDKWPDIKAMLEETEFDFLLDNKGGLKRELEKTSLHTVLDRHYYTALWKSMSSLPEKDKYAAQKILSDEISLMNSGWVLRLRTYYQMSSSDVKQHLIDIHLKGKKTRSLMDEASSCLDYPLDNYSSWSSWRWREFLNPDTGGRSWRADPRYFQNAASGYLYRLASHYFHLRPFSLDTIFCFARIKQFEEDILTSNAEGLGMGMSGKDTLSMLGFES